jgi:hypothetical protein
LRLLAIIDFTDKFDADPFQQWLDLGLELDLVNAINLGGNLERNAQPPRDRDGAVGTFFRRDSAEKGEVAVARCFAAMMQQGWNAVINRTREVRSWYRPTLRVRDRNQWHVAEAPVQRAQIG